MTEVKGDVIVQDPARYLDKTVSRRLENDRSYTKEEVNRVLETMSIS
jgi:hypothetical protein